MPKVTAAQARSFVAQAALPPARVSRELAAPAAPAAFDAARNEAAVVGAGVISFVTGVTAERREAIANASLLAQLVANHDVGAGGDIYQWYDRYFDTLQNIGWVVQQKTFATYQESGQGFAAHEAILAVATTLLGAAPTALAVVKSTLDALKSMDAGSPWITVFDRESQHAQTAHFQVGLAEQAADGQFLVTLMAFGLEADSTVTQVLFFKLYASQATLRHCSGQVSIDTAVMDDVADDLKAKLAAHAQDFIKKLPDLG